MEELKLDKMRINQFHTTDVKELSINGTTIESSADELDQFTLIGEIADVSAAASSWVVCPVAATIEKIYTVTNATTTGTAAISFEIGGTAVTGGGISIAAGAAGLMDSSTPTALNILTAGQPIEIITNGGSTNAAKGVVTFVMQRT